MARKSASSPCTLESREPDLYNLRTLWPRLDELDDSRLVKKVIDVVKGVGMV